MKVSELTAEDLTDELVQKMLYDGLVDTNQKGDCILVLGSIKAHCYRIPKAVELYQSKRATKIILSGGSVRDFDEGRMKECERMAMEAMRLGISEEALIMESMSKSTIENIICSLVVLEQKLKLYQMKEVLLVTTNYHMRRAVLTAETYLPDWIKVIPCVAEDNNTRSNNWFQSKQGRTRAYEEAKRIIWYVKEGCIHDFEVLC